MPRKIYEKNIYRRLKQTTRKVYDRANNVLPVMEGEIYQISSVAVKTAGEGYKINDILTIPGEDGDILGKVKVATLADEDIGSIATVELEVAGVYDTDLSGDIEPIADADVEGTGAVLTVTMEEIVPETEEPETEEPDAGE